MKVKDIFSTQWLTNDYVEDIQYLSDCVFGGQKENPKMWDQTLYEAILHFREQGYVDMDFAGSQVTNKVWETLDIMYRSHEGHVHYYDTEDEQRNFFFESYEGSFKNNKKEYEQLPAKPLSMKAMPKWVNDLQSDVTYDCISYDSHPEFLAMIQMMRPDIKMRCMNRSLFKYIHEKFFMNLVKEATEFRYITNAGDYYWNVEVDDDGNVQLLNTGTMTKRDFVEKYSCIPKWIGERRFDKRNATNYEEAAVRDILKDVEVFLAERPLTIKAIFEEE